MPIQMNCLTSLFTLIAMIHMHGSINGEECGTRFTDFASSAYLADVVLKGTVMEFHPSQESRNMRSANINVSDVFKGMQVLKSSGGMDQAGYLIVHNFGPENRDDCVVSDSDTIKDQPMVFFLRQTIDSSNNNMIEHSALPVAAQGDENMRIKRSVCDTCVEPPRITKVVCKDCAYVPVIRHIKSRKVRLGRRVRLRCKAKGKPAPIFSWLHNQLPLTQEPDGINIRSTEFTSTLVFAETTDDHAGEYTCIASNDLGKAEGVATLNVLASHQRRQKELKQPAVQDAIDKVLCDTNPCLNGGTCYYSQSLDLSVCVCTHGYEGVQCENIHTNTQHHTANIPVTNHNQTNITDKFDDSHNTSPMITTFKVTTESVNNRKESTVDEHNTDDEEDEHLRRFCLLQILCLNGGTCHIMSSQTKPLCVCINGFTGVRCETEGEDNKFEDSAGATSTLMSTIPLHGPSHSSTEQSTFSNSRVNQGNTSSSLGDTFTTFATTSKTRLSENGTNTQNIGGESYLTTKLSSTTSNQQINQNAVMNSFQKSTKRTQVDDISASVVGTPTPSYTRLKPKYRNSHGQQIFGYPVRSKSSLKTIPCKEKHFCFNKGKCRYIRKLNKKFCHCRTGYIGTRCERALN